MGVAESLVITLGSGFGRYCYNVVTGAPVADWSATFGAGLLSALLFVMTGRIAGLYSLPSLLHPAKQLKRILMVCGFVMLTLTATLFLLKIGSQFSRGSILGFAAAILVLCIATRIGAAGILAGLIRRNAICGRAAFLIGEPDELEALTPSYLLRHFGLREAGRMVVGTSADRDPDLQRRMDEALSRARAQQAREFIIATKWDSAAHLSAIEAALRASPLPIRLIPHRDLRSIIERHASAFDGDAHIVDLQRAPMSMTEQIAKRALDIVGASLGILVLVPIFIMAACAIKMDSPGPIIFRQRRNGFDKTEFVIFKFRTMRVLEDGAAVVQARRNDSRITRVGRFLRRTSIDELPQLFNVLRGDMSLVGPRPHALAHDQQYTVMIDDYCKRHHVKPGITGWAQVKGCRGETSRPEDMQRRVEFDLWYIKNLSFMLDLYILMRTAVDVAHHDAY